MRMLVVLLLMMILAACGGGESSDKPGWQTDQHEDFSISYPNAWYAEPSIGSIRISNHPVNMQQEIGENTILVVIIWSPPDADWMEALSPGEKLDRLFEGFIAQGGRFGYALDADEAISVNEQPARRATLIQHEMQYDNNYTSLAKEGLYYALNLENGATATVMCQSLQGDFAAFEVDCVGIAEMLRYQPAAG